MSDSNKIITEKQITVDGKTGKITVREATWEGYLGRKVRGFGIEVRIPMKNADAFTYSETVEKSSNGIKGDKTLSQFVREVMNQAEREYKNHKNAAESGFASSHEIADEIKSYESM